GQAVKEAGYLLRALCVGYDHSHAIVGRHERSIEQIARHLKSKATMALTRAGVHPLSEYRTKTGAAPTPWGKGEWSVFINDVEQLYAAMAYVERHPEKEGQARVTYPFIVAPRI